MPKINDSTSLPSPSSLMCIINHATGHPLPGQIPLSFYRGILRLLHRFDAKLHGRPVSSDLIVLQNLQVIAANIPRLPPEYARNPESNNHFNRIPGTAHSYLLKIVSIPTRWAFRQIRKAVWTLYCLDMQLNHQVHRNISVLRDTLNSAEHILQLVEGLPSPSRHIQQDRMKLSDEQTRV